MLCLLLATSLPASGWKPTVGKWVWYLIMWTKYSPFSQGAHCLLRSQTYGSLDYSVIYAVIEVSPWAYLYCFLTSSCEVRKASDKRWTMTKASLTVLADTSRWRKQHVQVREEIINLSSIRQRHRLCCRSQGSHFCQLC